MDRDFMIETTRNGVQLTRENYENLTINFVPGLCTASLDNPERPRTRKRFSREFLKPMIKAGKIGDGVSSRWDDRKIRIHSLTAKESRLDIAIGITYFTEYKQYTERTNEENLLLQIKGLEDFGERWAYFGRAPGISGMVLTQDGSAFLGVRSSDEFDNSLQPAAGHWNYQAKISNINLMSNLEQEIAEEFGVSRDSIAEIKPAGIFSDPVGGGIDFTYLIQTRVPDKYFLSGEWIKSAKDADENSRLVQVHSYQEAQQLLETGTLSKSDKKYGLMQSTRGALMSIRPEEMAA